MGFSAPPSDVASDDAFPRFDRQGESLGVVVADDHLSYLEALTLALRLRRRGDRVWGASDLDELLATVSDADVVVLDWLFGDVDGVQVARRLQQRQRPPHVVLVSGHHSPALELLASSSGVCAVLSKRASVVEIGAAIDRCRDEPDHERGGGVETVEHPLSRRQVEVLWLLSLGRDTRQVAEELFLSVATIRTYIRDACRRLGAHSQLDAVARARRQGLIPSEAVPPRSLGA